MDSVYKYGYCHRYRPGKVPQMLTAHSIEALGTQQWSDGFTTDWCPSDSRDTWNKREYLALKLGWTDNNVKYRFNQYGYRHQGDFVENRNALVALGCSLTFGIGVNYEQSWPYYVAKELGLDCVNLAQPGSAINASYRAAKMWLPIIKPKVVMFYVPSHHRRELWPTPDIEEEEHYADSCKAIGPWQTDKKYKEYFDLYSSKRETDIWREAYLDAMRWIARDSIYIHFPATMQTEGSRPAKDNVNDKIVVREMSQFNGYKHPGDEVHGLDEFTPNLNTDDARWARDMAHPGPRVHRHNIAPLFTGAYRGWDKEQIDAWRKENL